jgi:Kiwa protein KwaB-like
MAIRKPKPAVAVLDRLSKSATLRVELAVTSGKAGKPNSTRSLALSAEARGFFANASLGVATKLTNADAILAYDATYKPNAGEFEWAPLTTFPQIELAISRLEQFSTLGSFSPDDEAFKKELKYASTVLRDQSNTAYLFRAFTRAYELSEKKKITLMMRDGRFGPPTERLFQFDEDADAVVIDGVVLVVHKQAFRRIFEALAVVYAEAQTAAKAVHSKFPIKNFDGFEAAVGKDANLADKVIAVTRRPYFSALNMAAIEQTNTRFKLGVPIVVENGITSLEFRNDPGERWKLLKLLDDDHLTSPMTQADYDVNSKKAR